MLSRRTLLQCLASLPFLNLSCTQKPQAKPQYVDIGCVNCDTGCIMVGTLPKCDLGAPVYICDEGHLTLEQDTDRLCVGYVAGKHSDELTAVVINNFVW